MTPDELSAEKDIDAAMLSKINDILGKTQNAELISKYTKYKSDYEAKLLQIEEIGKMKLASKQKPKPAVIDFEKEAAEAAKLEEEDAAAAAVNKAEAEKKKKEGIAKAAEKAEQKRLEAEALAQQKRLEAEAQAEAEAEAQAEAEKNKLKAAKKTREINPRTNPKINPMSKTAAASRPSKKGSKSNISSRSSVTTRSKTEAYRSSTNKRGGTIVGGGPSDEYYSQGNVNTQTQYNPYGPQQMPYGPQPYNQQMPYGPQPYNQQMPYNQPYGQQPYGQQPPYGYPYNPQAQLLNMNQYSHSNRALELTSKLAYYVSVDLELYPGKSVNTVQMAAVKCGSTFERIREAWAEIMGYQYRPGAMDESYTYQNMPQDEKDKTKRTERGNEQQERERERENINGQTEPRKSARGGGTMKNKKSIKGKKRNVSCKVYNNKN